MSRTSAAAAALGLILTGAAVAGDPEQADFLTIGDKAPAIDVAHWLRSDKDGRDYRVVNSFEKDKVYVVEFWATWCGPCKASMPHLTSLQEKYRDYDVTIIGISDEPLPKVVEFLCRTDEKSGTLWYDRIGYTLATDPDESVKKDWFRAAGLRGIPASFIVGKDGHIEWIGHPEGMDEPLDAIVRDRWDRRAYRAQWEEEQAAERELTRAQTAIREAVAARKWDAAIEVYDRLIAKYPDRTDLRIEKFRLLIGEMGRAHHGYAFGEEIARGAWDDANLLNWLAWMVVDDAGVKTRDLEFALKAAERANELTSSASPAILDTLARVYYDKGDLKSAVKWQKLAVEHADAGAMGEDIRETLARYERALGEQ